jgi:hypothetical protein
MKLRRVGWADCEARMGETRNTYKILVGKPERKRYGSLGRKREDNIKIVIKESTV